MTPHEFVKKWSNVELKERSASQSHFNDLCTLLGVIDPISADPTGEWFTFEKGATKTGGGEGWADVWRRGCFGWEYKGRHANLDRAYTQLLQYAVALENPPLLIVSDMDRIVIRTNWTNSVQERHDIALEELLDGDVRARLKAVFTDPEAFRPAKSRQQLTEETAAEFVGLAQRLRDRRHNAHQVANFINRMIFCMFAEDVGLLPNHLFTEMLESSRRVPDEFTVNAATLFGAMARRGGKVGFTPIEWFNGGLFADDHVLPIEAHDIDQLLRAAKRDWSQIDPSILGTLFERGLDPAKRSQLGAHYTDRDKIMLIIRPVIIDPLEAEWSQTLAHITALIDSAPKRTAERLLTPAERGRTKKIMSEAAMIHSAFIERLAAFRVLDPACGSGNFLYVALRALKDIEHRANLDAEAIGLSRSFPRVGPENVLGIELNPYAAELARVSVWIGEIQWMRRNGFDAAKNPILRPLETIECRDAVLASDGTRAAWPAANVVVGNPPFLGNKKMIGDLGKDYTRTLRAAWPEVPGGVDLVCYWFAKAWAMMTAGQIDRAGLVTTNSIRGGVNRTVLIPIVEHGRIYEAWSDEGWTVDGAAVRVSLIAFERPGQPTNTTPTHHPGSKPGSNSLTRSSMLNGQTVEKILPNLTGSNGQVDLTRTNVLWQNEGVTFQGVKFGGPFEISEATARMLLCATGNPHGASNAAVIRRWITGLDLTRRPEERWCIDFGAIASADSAALFERPYAVFMEQWAAENKRRSESTPRKPALRANEAATLATPWLHQRSRPEMRQALAGLPRFIATLEVSKHRIFVMLPGETIASGSIYSIARDDDTTFGILHSRFHELWSLRMGTSLEDRPRYTASTTFETFPFPEGLTPNIPAADYADDPRARNIAVAAARLSELRENWLNPADLVERVPGIILGHPDRLVPRNEAAASDLKTRTITNLYNTRPPWLANAHATLDAAVAEAYGLGEDWRSGTLTDNNILAHLFLLNQKQFEQSKGA